MVRTNAINSRNPVNQIVSTSLGTLLTCNTVMPADNTIPQNTEGTEVITLAITPVSATSLLQIIFSGEANSSAGNLDATVALFQDTTANALAAKSFRINTSSATTGNIIYEIVSGTTSSTTFKIRIGPAITNVYVNADSSAGQLFNGVANTTLTIIEYL